MAKNGSNYWLGKLDQFLSLSLFRQTQELSNGLEALRRRKIPLSVRDAQRAKELLELLKELTDPLSEIKASLLAGLPREKWSGVGAGAQHDEAVGC